MLIRTKFTILGLVVASGLAIFAATAGVLLWQLKVNGPIYLDIKQANGVLADILPPPAYLMEAHLTTAEASKDLTSAGIGATKAKLASLETQFEQSVTGWEKRLPEGEMRVALMQQIIPQGRAYLKSVRDDFLPKLTQDTGALAQQVREQKLQPLYNAHRVGVDQLVKLANAYSARSEQTAVTAVAVGTWTMASIGIGVTIVLIGSLVIIARSIVRPLRTLEGYLVRVAHGDMTAKTDIVQNDELGTMAGSLDTTVGGLRGMIGGINQNAQGIAGAAEELSAVSRQLAGSAETSSSQSNQAATAVTQISASISTFAAGVEEMGVTVSEIAKSAGQAASVALEGVAAAGNANTAMNRLGASSNEIGEIIKVITGIAEQTNLLALNATIEAARAGDAGRGFAVVASEVKDLARKTSEATADIGRRVSGIQGDSKAAQEALRRITEIVDKINDFQQSIASAVEEQSATNKELAGNISQVSQASTEISKNVNAVAGAAKDAAAGAGETLKAANELAKLAADLRNAVARFKT